MPETLQALLALLIGVLPGAVYLWGFEREAGKWSIGLSDQLLRFVAASAVFDALYTAPAYLFYRTYLHHAVRTDHGTHLVYVNKLADGQASAPLLFVGAVIYVGLPGVVGTLAGVGVRQNSGWLRWVARWLVGRDPAPRAWDFMFASKPAGAVRMLLKRGDWVGGKIGDRSYASGYPEVPQDVLLEAYEMQPDGAFARTDTGDFVPIGSQLLVRWECVDLLEYFPDQLA